MLEDLKLNFGFKGIGKGVRPGNPFALKVRPVDVVARVSPTPVFFVHGDKDWLIKPRHSQTLFEKAQEPKRLKIIRQAGHAEKIFDAYPKEFVELCEAWFAETFKN